MKRLIAAAVLLIATPVFAADNAVIVTPGTGVTMKSKDIGVGVQAMQPILSDTSGNTLATPAAGADALTNSTEGLAVWGFPMVYNGTTWDRLRGDATNGAFVNVKTSVLPTGAATAAGITTLNTTLGSPFQAGGSIGNTTFAVTQATSSNLKAQVDPLTAASWGIGTATQNSASATNGQLALGQFNTTPTTITTGNMSPMQLDNAGNLLVNIKAGSSSGAVAQGSTTSGQTGSLIQGAVTTASPTYTTAQTSPLSLDTTGALRVNVTAGGAGGGIVTQATAANLNATVIGTGTFAVQAASATAPVSTMNSASASSGVNSAMAAVFDDVTPTAITENNFGAVRMSANRNLYGTIRDAAGNERGVNVDASNRLTTAPSMVSGSVASGAYASGAFASGSIASGAIASGAIAAGAQVDLLTMRGTVAAGTAAANSLLTGSVFNTTPPTLANGQQAALQSDTNGNLKVTAATLDPCQSVAKTSLPISQATSTQIITGTASKKTYICSMMVVPGDAENLSLVSGTGTVCATGIAAIIGGTTAANGVNLAANGGFTQGNGMAFVAAGVTNADNICLLQSGTGRVSGVLTYVQN